MGLNTGAKAVVSNQEGIYQNLAETVQKYARTKYLRPIADHTREAFAVAEKFVEFFYRGAEAASTAGEAVWSRHGGRDDNRGEAAMTEGAVRVAPAQGRGDRGDVASSDRGDSRDVAMAVILDSGCGTGESTLHIARRFPNIPVIGIDKSGERLTKAGNEHQLMNLVIAEQVRDDKRGEAERTEGAVRVAPAQGRGDSGRGGVFAEQVRDDNRGEGRGDSGGIPSNVLWVRAELLDFWRLALEQVQENRWTIPYHALYYPNPWPKQSEATRRFHLHPIFPTFMALSPVTELRTNWEIYAREFAEAARILDMEQRDSNVPTANIMLETFTPDNCETAFERKYREARQQLWRVTVTR